MDTEMRESARQLAEGISATLSDTEKLELGAVAREVVAGLTDSLSAPQDAVIFAMATARNLAMLQTTPLQRVGKIIDDSMVVYALAAGAAAGVFTLPAEEPKAHGTQPHEERETPAVVPVAPVPVGFYL